MSRTTTSLTILSLLFVFATSFIMSCTSANKELLSAEESLQMAAEEGASDTEGYKKAKELIEKAKELMRKGNHDEARKVLKEARFKAIEAIGEAKTAEYEDTITEEYEEMGKEMLIEGQAGNLDLVDIFFDYDQSILRQDAQQVLDKNAALIINGKMNIIVLEGYCDIRGSDEYNLALGQRRAKSVKSYLVGVGVSPEMIQVVSKGETEKWGSGTSESAYQQNRRVHFLPYSKKEN